MQGIFESNGKTERETLADQAVRFEGQWLIYICEKIKVKGKEVMEKKLWKRRKEVILQEH